MASARSSIGYPWILNAITNYNGETFMLKPAPAQIIEFIKMPERTQECQYPGAVVYISDRQYYIRAIITREAQETLEREDEHFTLDHIKNKIVILKKCTLSFAAEEDLRCCEFYLTIDHFCILAMEINTVDLLNCNMEPGVLNKIKELWQTHMEELQKEDTMSDMNSDLSLTQLLMIASEEKLAEVKSLAEQCLDLDSFATQDIAPQSRTIWGTEIRNNKSNDNSFSIPINLLLIPPEEEAALEQLAEFRPDPNTASDDDNSSEGSDSSQQYNSALSSISQEPMDDNCKSQPGNPWNNLPSLCVNGSIGSAQQYTTAVASLSQEPMDDDCNSQPGNPWNNLPSLCVSGSKGSGQQNIEKDPAIDSDRTPDILRYHKHMSLSVSSESQGETPPPISNLPSHHIQPEAKLSTSTNQTGASSHSDLPSSENRLSDCSQSLLSLMPIVQDSSIQIHTSPQKKVTLTCKVPISPVLSPCSKSKCDYKIIRNIFPANGKMYKETCLNPNEWKAWKRKQAPEDLDTVLSDQEQQEAVHRERPESATNGISKSIAKNGIQTETGSNVGEKDKTTNDISMDKNQTRTERVNKTGIRKTAGACGTTPPRKKKLPYKPCLEFVSKPKMKVAESSKNALPAENLPTTSRTGSKDPSNVSQGQTSSFKALVQGMKKTKMTHYDGKSFQYKYKPPSADLCACVNAARMPAGLYEWAVKILSEAKEVDP